MPTMTQLGAARYTKLVVLASISLISVKLNPSTAEASHATNNNQDSFGLSTSPANGIVASTGESMGFSIDTQHVGSRYHDGPPGSTGSFNPSESIDDVTTYFEVIALARVAEDTYTFDIVVCSNPTFGIGTPDCDDIMGTITVAPDLKPDIVLDLESANNKLDAVLNVLTGNDGVGVGGLTQQMGATC